MRIVTTGSRSWRDYQTIRSAISKLPEGSTVVHGGATGADAMVQAAASALGYNVEVYWPDYENKGVYNAPLARNDDMVQSHPDIVLAFPTKNSKGTWHCVNAAKKLGIKVVVRTESGN